MALAAATCGVRCIAMCHVQLRGELWLILAYHANCVMYFFISAGLLPLLAGWRARWLAGVMRLCCRTTASLHRRTLGVQCEVCISGMMSARWCSMLTGGCCLSWCGTRRCTCGPPTERGTMLRWYSERLSCLGVGLVQTLHTWMRLFERLLCCWRQLTIVVGTKDVLMRVM